LATIVVLEDIITLSSVITIEVAANVAAVLTDTELLLNTPEVIDVVNAVLNSTSALVLFCADTATVAAVFASVVALAVIDAVAATVAFAVADTVPAVVLTAFTLIVVVALANTELFLIAVAVSAVSNSPSIDTLALALFCADTDIDAVVPKLVDPANILIASTDSEVAVSITTDADCILCAVAVSVVEESASTVA
jgi:hypothetical protein